MHGDPQVYKDWPKVSVVIPLHGGEEDIRICLDSLAAVQDLLHEVIVVDDASPDNAAVVAQGYGFVRVVASSSKEDCDSFDGVPPLRFASSPTPLAEEGNLASRVGELLPGASPVYTGPPPAPSPGREGVLALGFASTCNRGTELSTGDVVLYLNSDTAVPRAGLVRLVETLMSSGSVGAAGPFTNNAGYEQPTFATYTSLDTLDLFAQDFAHREVEDRDVTMLVGFCLAVRRSVLNEVGLFDTRFGRGLFEDTDLVYRIQRAGYRCRLSGRAYVHHKGSQSLKRLPESPHALLERNRGLYEAKWREDLESGFASHLPGQREEPIVFNHEREPGRLKREMLKLRDRADITLTMIVRNEERVLADCLRSIEGVFKQVVIVDTGSTDRTMEIAKEFGVELYEAKWQDSFAAARNEALKHARGKWVFWMDADDTLPRSSAEAILQTAIDAPGHMVGYVVPVQFVDGGVRVDHVKLFRNLPGLTWEGRIHEQILPWLRQTGGMIDRVPGAVVLHSGYDTSPEGQARKRRRDEKLLNLDVKDRPTHPFPHFNIGMTAHHLNEHAKAIKALRKCLSLSDPTDSHVRKTYAMMGASTEALKGKEAALDIYREGLLVVPDDPELRFRLANVLSDLGQLEESRAEYLAINPDISGHFSSIDLDILGPKRWHNLGNVCLQMHRYMEAKEHFTSAINSGFAPSAASLFDAANQHGDLKTASEALEALGVLTGRGEDWAVRYLHLASLRGEDPSYAVVQAMSQWRNAIGPRLIFARNLLNSGQEAAAEPHLEMLDHLGCAEAAFYRGVIEEPRNAEAALKHFRRALDLNPLHRETAERINFFNAAGNINESLDGNSSGL